MNWMAICPAITLSLTIASLAPAQQLPFQLSLTVGTNVVTIQNRSTVALSSAVGQAQTARVKATYTGSDQVTISQQPISIGSVDFSAQATAALPISLNRGDS